MNIASEGSMNLDFALHHAVNLAESGPTVQDKRIGEGCAWTATR